MSSKVDVLTSFGIDRTREVNWGIEELLAILEKHEVERALTLSLRAVHYAGPEGNDETREVCAQHEALEPVGVVDPQRYFDCFEEVRRRTDEGFRAFRFFPQEQNWSVEGANFLKICELLAELQARVLIAAGPSGQPTAIATGVAEMDLPVMLIGAGYSTMGEVMAVLESYPNMHTEAHVMDSPGTLELLLQSGPGRVMFGSDSPGVLLRESVADGRVRRPDRRAETGLLAQ